MLRFIVVACCAALAAADADAFYGSYGYGGLGYTSALGHSSYGYAAPIATHASYGYAAPVAAHAAYGYAAPAQSAAIAVRGYGTPATVGATVPYGYAASGHYVADSVGAVHVAKREAEADADAFYGSFGYNGLGYTSALGYSNHAYTTPIVNHAAYGYAAPVAAYGYAAPAQSAAIAVRGYGTPATIGSTAPYGYAASGRYVADSVGAVHVAKREAEADADALYRSYGYSGLGYGGYSTLGYRGLGYSNRVYSRSYGLGYGYPYYG